MYIYQSDINVFKDAAPSIAYFENGGNRQIISLRIVEYGNQKR